MTPKEKAEELVNRYLKILAGGFYDVREEAKECALITVEHLINEYLSFPRGTGEESRALYYLKVKQELERL